MELVHDLCPAGERNSLAVRALGSGCVSFCGLLGFLGFRLGCFSGSGAFLGSAGFAGTGAVCGFGSLVSCFISRAGAGAAVKLPDANFASSAEILLSRASFSVSRASEQSFTNAISNGILLLEARFICENVSSITLRL